MIAMPTTESQVVRKLQDGVLNVHKEAGWTSHDVVARIRGKLRGIKLGHAGTLDPAATGVLPLLLGRGTRIAEYLLEWDKTYLAELRLGETTDTQDATGAVLQRSPVGSLSEACLREVVAGFEGRYSTDSPHVFSGKGWREFLSIQVCTGRAKTWRVSRERSPSIGLIVVRYADSRT
jgi:tRNA pseudouridine(55) synthase